MNVRSTGIDWQTCSIGADCEIWEPVNILGCKIGFGCRIAPFVEIQRYVVIGDRCNIGTGAFIAAGTQIADEVFVGQGVRICNCQYPRAVAVRGGQLKTPDEWALAPVRIARGASIGSNSTILPGVVIGEDAMIGAGSVVTTNVPKRAVFAGNPARLRAGGRGHTNATGEGTS